MTNSPEKHPQSSGNKNHNNNNNNNHENSTQDSQETKENANSQEEGIKKPRSKIPKSKNAFRKKSLNSLNETIRKRENKLKRDSDAVSQQKLRLNKLKQAKEGGVVEVGAFEGEDVPKEAAEVAKELEVIWKPHEGVQTDFLRATEYEVLFSGSRGSGKSQALIVDPLRYCTKPKFRGLVIRRTMAELEELISRAKAIYPKAYPGTKWKAMEKYFLFPSGARMNFGYCDNEDDVLRYQGQEYTWLGIDEITQYPSSKIIEDLKASIRTTDPDLPIQLRFTCNPSGAGRGWVKERWIDVAPSGQRVELYGAVEITESENDIQGSLAFLTLDTIKAKNLQLYLDPDTNKPLKITRKWFHSTLSDNPTLLKANPTYRAVLASIPDPVRRAQWLSGSWDVIEGLAFNEFNRNTHVIEPFKIPNAWYKIRCCDWGYARMAVCLWLAIDWDDNVFVYREYKTSHETADDFSINILDKERGEIMSSAILDGSVWSRRGEVGESVADTMLKYGLGWTPSDRSPGSRVNRKAKLHKYLKVQKDTGQPKIKIFSNCIELIKELSSLMLDPNNPEDVDKSRKTSLPDDAYDALTYGLASLSEINTVSSIPHTNEINRMFQNNVPQVVNPSLGM